MAPRTKNNVPTVVSQFIPNLDDQPSYIRVESLTDDGRRLRQQRITVAPLSPEALRRPRRISSVTVENAYSMSEWVVGVDEVNLDEDPSLAESIPTTVAQNSNSVRLHMDKFVLIC